MGREFFFSESCGNPEVVNTLPIYLIFNPYVTAMVIEITILCSGVLIGLKIAWTYYPSFQYEGGWSRKEFNSGIFNSQLDISQ